VLSGAGTRYMFLLRWGCTIVLEEVVYIAVEGGEIKKLENDTI